MALLAFLHRRVYLAAAALAAAGGLLAAPPAQAAASPEYQVKAVFLFNFAHFVEWSPDAFSDPAAPLVIGVLGADPFDTALDETIRGEKVGGHPLVIRHYARVEDVNDCHILFISRSEAKQLPEIYARLLGRRILTVGDADGFAVAGGMIQFVTANSRTRLRVNLKAANAAHVSLNSKLLRLAEVVGDGHDGANFLPAGEGSARVDIAFFPFVLPVGDEPSRLRTPGPGQTRPRALSKRRSLEG